MNAVALAVVISPLGVLVVRRTDGRPPWAFPGGTIEPGETPATAAAREVQEETGCPVRITKVLGHRVHPETGRHITYLAAEPAGPTDITASAPSEIAEARWLTLAEATALLPGMYAPVAAHLAATLPALGERRAAVANE